VENVWNSTKEEVVYATRVEERRDYFKFCQASAADEKTRHVAFTLRASGSSWRPRNRPYHPCWLIQQKGLEEVEKKIDSRMIG
jgi:hypothetical protein